MPSKFVDIMTELIHPAEPMTYQEAIQGEHADKWKDAMTEETKWKRMELGNLYHCHQIETRYLENGYSRLRLMQIDQLKDIRPDM
jgi:hypothetical protein